MEDSKIPPFPTDLDGVSLGDLPPELLRINYHVARTAILRRFEKEYLVAALQCAKGNVSEAARLAGVDRVSFYRLIKKYEISRDSSALATVE